MPEAKRAVRLIDVTAKRPVNGTAAAVVSPGVRYDCPKRVQTAESEVPFPVRTVPRYAANLTGTRRGSLVVAGLCVSGKGLWSCRCDCGKYVLRRAKALTNERNDDRCEECRHLAYLRRTQEFRLTGKNTHEGWR